MSNLYYLSFATADRFLGATVVEADDAIGAVARAHELKINPGGEVMIIEVPKDLEARPDVALLRDRLADEAEMRSRGGKKTHELDPDVRRNMGLDDEVAE